MAVSSINPTHSAPQEKPAVPVAHRAQNGASKSTASTAAVTQEHKQGGQGTTAATAVENQAGQEQGNAQHSEQETKGTRVNVYA